MNKSLQIHKISEYESAQNYIFEFLEIEQIPRKVLIQKVNKIPFMRGIKPFE